VKRKVNRVPYVIAASVTAFCNGVLFTWSYFRSPLSELFPTWTTGDLSLVFSVHNAVVCVFMIVAGKLLKKFSTRALLAAAGIMIGGGLAAFSLLPRDNPELALAMAVFFFGGISAAGVGTMGVTMFSAFLPWFPRHVGTISGLMMMLGGTCAIVMGAISGLLIPALGILSAIRILGLIVLVLMALVIRWTLPPGPEVELPAPPVREENREDRSFSVMEMLKSPLFWALFLFNIMLRSSCLIYMDHAAQIALFFGTAALFGMLFSPANGAASILTGTVLDRLSSGRTMLLISAVLFLASGALIIGSAADSAALILFGLIAVGAAAGGTNTVTAAATRILFGSGNYGQNYSIMGVSILVSSVICYASGLLVERMGNRYGGVFILTLAFSVIAIICSVYLIRKAGRRKRQREGS